MRPIAVAVFLLVAAVGHTPAAAEGLNVRYVVAWAGLELGSFTFELAEAGDRYRTGWSAGTSGLARRLFPFTSAGTSSGRRLRDGFVSERYQGSSRWRDGEGSWAVDFAPDGRATRVAVAEPIDRAREPVPPALQIAPDPVALALAALAAAGPGARFSGRSFDGRRVASFEAVCASQPEAATGELTCSIDGTLLAGASREQRAHQADAGEREPLEVRLRQGVVPGGWWWPVRLDADARLGRVTARLAGPPRPPHIGG